MRRLANAYERYFFSVPADTNRFRIGVAQDYGLGECGVAVYDPSDALVQRHTWADVPQGEWQYLEFAPAREQRGKLWSVTIAVSGQYKLELDGVPPYVAHRPEAHFVP